MKIIIFTILIISGIAVGYLISSLLNFNLAFLDRYPVVGIVSIILISFIAAELNIRILDKYLQTEYYILGVLVYPFVFGVTSGFILPVIIDY